MNQDDLMMLCPECKQDTFHVIFSKKYCLCSNCNFKFNEKQMELFTALAGPIT